MRRALLFGVIGAARLCGACRSSETTPAERAAPSTSAPAPAKPLGVSEVSASSRSVSSAAAPWLPWPAPDAAELRSGQREASFALTVAQHLASPKAAGSEIGSFVFAPVSLAAVLALAYEGARGATRVEIGNVLGLDAASGAEEALSVARLATFATSASLSALHSTAIWAAPGVAPRAEFRQRAEAQYHAALLLGKAGESPTSAINAWLQHAMGTPAELLFAADSVRADARLALVDFLSVEGAWRTPFAEERTRPLPFTRIDGRKTKLPTMTSVSNVLFASGPDFDAVELALMSPAHHLCIVLPKLGELSALQSALAVRLPAIRAALRPIYAELQLPRYKLSNTLSLREALASAGMASAFSESADFGAMSTERVYLDQVLQNVAFEVNERGLRATSATVASFPPPSAPKRPVLIQINRPFLFSLLDIRTGAILFWGTYLGAPASAEALPDKAPKRF